MMERYDWKQAVVIAGLGVLLVITLLPFATAILLSQKSNAEIYTHFWALPDSLHPDYFTSALQALKGYIGNSLIVCTIAVAGVVLLSSISGYVFARMRFAGKEFFYTLLLALMMVPGILTLIPLFKWVLGFPLVGGNDFWGNGGSGLTNTWFALWVPYWAGGQIFGILICRTFFEALPEDLFEAARIDGASDMQIYTRVVVPLSLPILATLAIIQFVACYNDYIWPLVAISSPEKQVFAVGVTLFGAEENLDIGPQMAGFLIGSIPLVILFVFGMKYYVQGLTSGALKA